nr:transcription factor bHLH52-like [Ipomoea batatas]
MASLSYCSNWEISHDDHYLNFSETLDSSGLVMTSPPFFPRQQTLVDDVQLEAPAPELLFGFNNRSLFLPEESLLFPFDPLFNSGEFIFSDNYVSPPAPVPEYSFPEELEFQAHPKRQKLYHGHFAPEITQNCFGAALVPDFSLLQDLKPPPPPPSSSFPPGSLLPELPSGSFPAYCDGGEIEVAKKNDSGKCGVKTLSAQSIAARERRRRIAEKTQELGKLIPGGQKMNTAEMFQAGYNYIKFMQTQLSVLQSCHHSSQESGETYIFFFFG